MKTTILLAAAMIALPLGVVASPAQAGSAITAEEEAKETKKVDLEVSNMR